MTLLHAYRDSSPQHLDAEQLRSCASICPPLTNFFELFLPLL
ncbi:Uncharacterized protein APZ42_030986 [Daphnia magna]|uniref:Uncharacterized protein n=1 Tax=Daphnia magna TaxID=35525 RepID=A0A162DCD2_9CRUS|nr:Uncharacterized protein APZ42_030986 [Daphnia magna]